MSERIWVKLPSLFPFFNDWLEEENKKKFEIQLRKYFELKFTKYGYTEEDIETLIQDVYDFVNYLD